MVDNRTPEVRRLLHNLGYRYRLHSNNPPGRPDIALPRPKKVIFVNGRFRHGHDCRKGREPESRPEYWGPKLRANRERDIAKAEQLVAHGWEVLTVWQCETVGQGALALLN
jgi:DNA mismatch endonuclease (patch repair protein)